MSLSSQTSPAATEKSIIIGIRAANGNRPASDYYFLCAAFVTFVSLWWIKSINIRHKGTEITEDSQT